MGGMGGATPRKATSKVNITSSNMGKQKRIKQLKKIYRRRNNKLKDLGYENYNQYLNSDIWRETKKKKKRTKCVCGSNKKLHLHHKTYERVGDEHLRDLVWLCKECHEYLHDNVNLGNVAFANSLSFLIKKRGDKIRRERKRVKVEHRVGSRKFISHYKGVKVRKYKQSKKHLEWMKYRAKQVNEKTERNVASQKYKVAFKEWLANKDYTVPKPIIEQFLTNSIPETTNYPML